MICMRRECFHCMMTARNCIPKRDPTMMTKIAEMRRPILPSYAFPESQAGTEVPIAVAVGADAGSFVRACLATNKAAFSRTVMTVEVNAFHEHAGDIIEDDGRPERSAKTTEKPPKETI